MVQHKLVIRKQVFLPSALHAIPEDSQLLVGIYEANDKSLADSFEAVLTALRGQEPVKICLRVLKGVGYSECASLQKKKVI